MDLVINFQHTGNPGARSKASRVHTSGSSEPRTRANRIPASALRSGSLLLAARARPTSFPRDEYDKRPNSDATTGVTPELGVLVRCGPGSAPVGSPPGRPRPLVHLDRCGQHGAVADRELQQAIERLPWRQAARREQQRALGVAAEAEAAPEVLGDHVVVDVLPEHLYRLRVAAHDLHLGPGPGLQQVAEGVPGLREDGRGPDDEHLARALRDQEAAALHELGNRPRGPELGLIQPETLEVHDDEGRPQRHASTQRILLQRAETSVAEHHVYSQQHLPGHGLHEVRKLATPDPLQRHGLTSLAVAQVAARQPPRGQALLVRL
mmetsp:Transcript_24610/g.70229  ORF Transcript_24610/g.70229 Transcript_24610/m.70229 type:complete len:322 (+) Transcript_24610:263-1228(+)